MNALNPTPTPKLSIVCENITCYRCVLFIVLPLILSACGTSGGHSVGLRYAPLYSGTGDHSIRESAGSEYGTATSATLNQTVVSGKPQATLLLHRSAMQDPASLAFSKTTSTVKLDGQTRTIKSTTARQTLLSYTASLSMESDTIERSLSALDQLATDSEGYVLNESTNRRVFRIPSPKFREFLDSAGRCARLLDKQIQTRDESDEYYDLELRLSLADSARHRYEELLHQSKDVETTLKVEHELERLRTEIELLKARQLNTATRLNYAEVYINVTASRQNETRPGPLGYLLIGAYKAVRWLFVWDS